MNWLDFIRGVVRPYLTISGWTAMLVIASILAVKFADRELAVNVLSVITGAMATIIGFWFGQRRQS